MTATSYSYIYSLIYFLLFLSRTAACWLLNVTHWLGLRNFSCYYQRMRLICYTLAQTQTTKHEHTLLHTHSINATFVVLLHSNVKSRNISYAFILYTTESYLSFFLYFCNNVDDVDDGKSAKPARQFSLSYCFLIIFSASYFHICRQKQSCALSLWLVVVIAASALLFLHTHTHTHARTQAQLVILLAFS